MNDIYTRKTLWSVWAILLLLMGVTVAVSFVHFGQFNAAVALSIAVVKATLIAAYFMRLRTSGKLLWVVAAASIVWLAIMFTLTFSDYDTRKYLPKPTVWAE